MREDEEGEREDEEAEREDEEAKNEVEEWEWERGAKDWEQKDDCELFNDGDDKDCNLNESVSELLLRTVTGAVEKKKHESFKLGQKDASNKLCSKILELELIFTGRMKSLWPRNMVEIDDWSDKGLSQQTKLSLLTIKVEFSIIIKIG